MARRNKIYEGKAKILYEGPEPGTIVQYFKDDATAFNAEKKATIEGKGVLNNRLSEFFMTGLNNIGVPTHFIKRLNMREQLVRQVEIIPLEVIVRNYAAGSMSKRLGIEEGTQLPRPIVEYCYKDDALGDPLVTEEHIAAFGWATQQDMDDILSLALRVNDFMSGVMMAVGIDLARTMVAVMITHLSHKKAVASSPRIVALVGTPSMRRNNREEAGYTHRIDLRIITNPLGNPKETKCFSMFVPQHSNL